jgi:2-polyprenyl-6-hydroxyphenyl methylase/3-demethylubiquinone-9 3-methyltransferase
MIVDAGCGFGLMSALMAIREPGREVIGLDLDPSRIRRARQLFGEIPNLKFEACSLEDAQIPSCEGVLVYDVLHHLSRPRVSAFLKEVRRKLRGKLVIKENDVEPAWKYGVSVAIEWVALEGGITMSDPVEFRSRLEWVKTLEAEGFGVQRAEHLRARAGFFVPHSLFVAI